MNAKALFLLAATLLAAIHAAEAGEPDELFRKTISTDDMVYFDSYEKGSHMWALCLHRATVVETCALGSVSLNVEHGIINEFATRQRFMGASLKAMEYLSQAADCVREQLGVTPSKGYFDCAEEVALDSKHFKVIKANADFYLMSLQKVREDHFNAIKIIGKWHGVKGSRHEAIQDIFKRCTSTVELLDQKILEMTSACHTLARRALAANVQTISVTPWAFPMINVDCSSHPRLMKDFSNVPRGDISQGEAFESLDKKNA